jgi:hypothetical protein
VRAGDEQQKTGWRVNFWEKLQSLFVHDATAVIPKSPPRMARRTD